MSCNLVNSFPRKWLSHIFRQRESWELQNS